MKVIVNDLAVEYLEEGQGAAMLMLHGWGETMHHFDALCAELSGFRMLRLDLPGFGQSQTPQGPWTVEDYARFIVAFCDKVGVEPASIVGHSLGGRIIIKGLSLKLFNPSKVVLIASAGVANRLTLRNFVFAVAAKFGKYLLQPFSKTFYERMRRRIYALSGSDYLTVGGMEQTFLNTIRENLRGAATDIAVPTLLVWGENDVITPLKEGILLHQLIEGSKLHVEREAGHFVNLERPKQIAAVMQKFLV